MARRRAGCAVAIVLVTLIVGGAVEAVGIGLGWWVLTRLGQATACSLVAVLAVLLWVVASEGAKAEGRHSAAASAAVRARAVAEAYEAETIPEALRRRAGLPGPPFAAEERRAPGRPMPGGRRRTDPPLSRGVDPDA